MSQVDKHCRKGYSKFIVARSQDSALMLGTQSYAGRLMLPMATTLRDGNSLRIHKRKPGSKWAKIESNSSGSSEPPEKSALSMLRQRALVKAAKEDPRYQKMLDKKKQKERQEQKDKKSAEDIKLVEDPVGWFGCLIPQEVRLARDDFASGLEKIVRMAEIRRAMIRIEKEVPHLRSLLQQQ
eukprot:CAMPEP_0197518756 /NCGR_PEP_ID=MMETSP1318-20131121/3993_1 /TAXON_ID=552666 /ORGANISM="Partenskyella glossopodia, Strain RCC365" /LENGTH=181 /DNA_ID=CAMNT_0043069343 /DNA_START=63 /DNA_END=608 /DNA_ORIENTATION=+